MEWLLGISALLALIALGVPIAFAMTGVAAAGLAALIGPGPMLAMLGQVYFDSGMSYTLSVMPLFVLMGNLVVQAGAADEFFTSAQAWLGHRRGGLAMATVVACGGFASVCGSSVATAATMARVAMAPMRRYGYSGRLAAGTIAAGGTLGILIPPSVALVLYGIMTREDIGKLFLAGLLPGLVGILGYMAAVRLSLWITGEQQSRPPPPPLRDRLRALRHVAGAASLFVLVMGGIYLRVFTATEAAGVGAAGAFVLAFARRRLDLRQLAAILIETATMTASLFFILFGAILFSNYVNLAGLPQDVQSLLKALGARPTVVLLVVFAIYLVLGMVLESLSMMLLTVPVFLPVVQALGIDPIWFGIFVVMAVEISLITPPVGLNVFVLRSVLPETDARTIFVGVLPFVAVDILRVLLLLAFPALALAIPRTM